MMRGRSCIVRSAFGIIVIIMAISCAFGYFFEEDMPGVRDEISEEGGKSCEYVPINYDMMKAIWLSQYDMYDVYTQGGRQRDEGSFRRLSERIAERISESGFNTVIVQVRPFGDSMYPSEIFTPCYIVTGEYGRGFDYDALEIFIAEAHDKGLSVHAWINPLRTMSAEDIIKTKMTLGKWYCDPQIRGRYIVNVEGREYLNPAYPDVRSLICAGVDEILSKYDVDGVHIDDYFYPTTEEYFDREAYLAYLEKGGSLSLAQFRRSELNKLIRSLYDTVHKYEGAVFGISPGGNIDMLYNEQYGDIYTWFKESGYADYICPQIYFGFEHSTYPFDKVCDRFSKIAESGNVKLCIGIALYKAGLSEDAYAGEGKYEWIEKSDVISRSILYTAGVNVCRGIAIFSYKYLYDPITDKVPALSEKEVKGMMSVLASVYTEKSS